MENILKLKFYLLNSNIGSFIVETRSEAVDSELALIVSIDNLAEVLEFLRDDKECEFQALVDICGVDYVSREFRFEVVYNLLSISKNQRIRVKVQVNEQNIIPTVMGFFSSANWYEREVWDMYGIYFKGHPDLRRILTDYGFNGHPMRKDFPLSGYVEVRYDIEKQQVVYEPVNLSQEYRNFNFSSPWEGPQYALPGDEKASS